MNPAYLAKKRRIWKYEFFRSPKGKIILRGFNNGDTLETIAHRLGLTRQRVLQLVNQMGLKTSMTRQIRRQKKENKILPTLFRLLSEGWSLTRIERVVKIKISDLRRLCKEHGVSITPDRPSTLRNGKISPEYQIYRNMLGRCYNSNHPSYSRYGGANPPVLVCERWRGTTGWKYFVEDMGLRPEGNVVSGKRALYSIHRADNVPFYSKETCVWATQKEQCAPGQRRNPASRRRRQNAKMSKSNTSGFKGVSRAGESWVYQLKFQGKWVRRQFSTALEAALAYDKKAVEVFGSGAVTNYDLRNFNLDNQAPMVYPSN